MIRLDRHAGHRGDAACAVLSIIPLSAPRCLGESDAAARSLQQSVVDEVPKACLVLVLLGSLIVPASAQFPDLRPPSGSAQNLNPLSTLDPGALDAFKGRPLFAPSRRPPPPRQVLVAPPAPLPVEAPPPDLRLVGVVAGVDNAVAILRRPAGGPSLSLKLGDTIETWHVKAIGPDRVTLRDGTRETTYRLFSVGPSGPPGLRSNGVPLVGIPPTR